MMKRTLCTMIVSLLIIGGVTPIWAENFSEASSSIEIKNQDLAFGKNLADQRDQIDPFESAKNPLLLNEEEKLQCEEAIKKFLLKNYEGYYSFDHFDFDYQGLFEEQGIIEVDILLRVDMTLIKDPNEYARVQELRKQLATQERRGDMEENLERYVSYIRKECYKKPDATSFPFAIKLNQERKVQEMFYKDIQSDELLPLDVLKVQDSVKGTISAEEALLMDSVPEPTRAGYDNHAARDYARAHAKDDPEFPSGQVDGTDCANFVSKCFKAGGVPEDRPGKWYQANPWGSWPGDNFYRTGWHNNGGVAPYMVKKNYVREESDRSKVFAGSIIYETGKSHVALCSYGDGTTIKYCAHSKPALDTVLPLSGYKFYVPK